MALRKKKIDGSSMQVMTVACSTCPFENAHKGGRLRPETLTECVEQVVTLQSQHLCHTVNNKKLCRGARTLMLRVMCMQGLIDAPTDEAYDRARIEVLGK